MIKKLHQNLTSKKISAQELATDYLKRIKKEDKKINAYLSILEERALKQAKKIDAKITAGEKIGPLAGIPAAIKDNILIKGEKCTAGSKMLENYTASYDAAVIEKLEKAGAVFLGKTNLDEFAMGSSTENSAFGPTKNPRNPEYVPGGSSGGSAAATASDTCVFALGSDTGGSIRQPASFCGVLGLKPTYGAVSRHGLIAMASSLDQIGPFAKSAEDAAIVFSEICGRDKMDSTSNDYKFDLTKFENAAKNIKDLKIGVPKEYFIGGIDSRVESAIDDAIAKFEKMGARTLEISLPHTEQALACYYIIVPAEVSANMARYDGIKYGYSEKGAKELWDVYFESRQKAIGPEVRRRIMLGTYVLSAGYYDAYYLKAQKVRTLIRRDFEEAFKKVDVILTPTSPTLPFKFGEKIADPMAMYLSDVFTVPINLAGVPALSFPCGEADGLPVGAQLIGKWFSEETILGAAMAFENIKLTTNNSQLSA